MAFTWDARFKRTIISPLNFDRATLWKCTIQRIHNYWVPVICSFGCSAMLFCYLLHARCNVPYRCHNMVEMAFYILFVSVCLRVCCMCATCSMQICSMNQKNPSQAKPKSMQRKTKRWYIVLFVNRCTYSSERQNNKFPKYLNDE